MKPQPNVHSGQSKTSCLNQAVLVALFSRFRRAIGNRMCALRFAGAVSGETITLPVEYVRTGRRLVVLAGQGDTKVWWRNFHARRPVEVWLGGRWLPGTAVARLPGDPDRPAALAVYRAAHKKIRVDTVDPLVCIELDFGPTPRSGRSLWLYWFLMVTLGECLGFAVPATVGALTTGSPVAVSVPLLISAGCAEGALLGWFQAQALRWKFPGFPLRRWCAATAAAAAFAWAIGLMPSTLHSRLDAWPAAVLVTLAAVGGLVLLLSIGTAQWLVLRTRVSRASQWIWGTALAWTVALGIFTAITTPLWQPKQPVFTIALIGVLGGLVMAATAAALTGLLVIQLTSGRVEAL